MGFDNECIVNIQSLPGEYFCPVCRTLIYPNEALQSQCTHLYCKPCLAYVVSTTHACPYDGYLVTEADSKPLIESNKSLAETIGKVAVHCLYHRSGCTWQGTLAECTTHCTGCNCGNSPVVCNCCGTQIIHRQVQEHAQICPGIQPQAQQVESAESQAAAPPSQAPAQDSSATTAAVSLTIGALPATPASTIGPTAAASAPAAVPSVAPAAPAQAQVQNGAPVYPQASIAEQWYQQQQLQYQQYYQQYAGYDPYQQQYQQYAQYQQQAHPPYMQPQMQAASQHVALGQQPQPYIQPQPQSKTQLQQAPPPQVVQPQLQQHLPHPQLQQQPLPRAQPQSQPHLQGQFPQMQAQQPHVPSQAHPPPQGQMGGQPHHQPLQLHPQPLAQARPPQLPGPPQHQQPMPPQQHPPVQMPYPQPHPQQQLRPQHPTPQTQQPAVQPHPQTIPPSQASHPPVHAVSGYQSHPQPVPGAPQQCPMHTHPQQSGMPPPPQHSQHPPQAQGQFPLHQPPQMRPPHQMLMQVQKQSAMAPTQGPPANLHPCQQQVQHLMHQPGMQQHPPKHGFAQPQAQGHLHLGQMQQQGALPSQQQIYPQQPLRPQGPAYMQQHITGQPAPQGLPGHAAQVRPLVPNHGIPQQSQQFPGAGPKLMQPVQSPNQTYPGRSTRMPTPSELQQSQLLHSGSQGSTIPTFPATAKQGMTLPDNTGQLNQSEAGMTTKVAEGAGSPEKFPDRVSDTKAMSGEEKSAAAAVKEENSHLENDGNGLPESSQRPESLGSEENADGKVKAKDDDANNTSNEETRGRECKPDEKSGAQTQGEVASSDRAVQRSKLEAKQTQQMPAPGALGSQHVQPVHQTALPAQENGLPQPAYSDRNPSQFPQHYPALDDRRGVHAGGAPFPNQERYPLQQVPYGQPPNLPVSAMVSQRPPAPDRMFPQSMQPSSQERRFPEPPPHEVQVHAPSMPPSQMRPPVPGHNYRETFPHQGQTPVAREPVWPPPHAGAPGLGLPPPPAVVPRHPPHAGFEQHSMLPSGLSQSHMPPPHAGLARAAPGEPFARSGAPPGSLDMSNGMIEGGVGRSPPVHSMEAEQYDIKSSRVYDGQPSGLKFSGMPSKASIGGMHDSAFARGMPEDRFRPLPEERFKPFPEERFSAPQDRLRPSALDPGRNVNRREFEDLKQFPRPPYLDEGPKFDGYMSSSRPSDRAPHVSGGPNATTSRPLPSYQSASPFPPSAGGSVVHLDIGDRERSAVLHEHMVRKHDTTIAGHHNPPSDFGHHIDGLPPSPGREHDGFSSSRFGLSRQSHREDFDERDPHGFGQRFKTLKFPPPGPGYFSREYPDGPGSLRSDHMGSGSLPGHLGRGLNGPDIPNRRGGEPVGGVSFRSHLGINEHGGPRKLPSHLRFGDSGFNEHFNSVSREGELDTFELSRKRKPGSMGWCRICKIDCETVEGLVLHSQSREHQKMAMDLVLRIKRENAKKHKLTSEIAMSLEDSNKSRKANFENAGKRQ